MSNILIIKYGSLGDLIKQMAQCVIKNHLKTRALLLTSRPYLELMSECPYIDGVILDKRLPRWNLFYLLDLRRLLLKYQFLFYHKKFYRTKFIKIY